MNNDLENLILIQSGLTSNKLQYNLDKTFRFKYSDGEDVQIINFQNRNDLKHIYEDIRMGFEKVIIKHIPKIIKRMR